MSTTSTVVAFRAALLAALAAHATVVADGIQVADGWQGPDTEDEGIYLTGLILTSEPMAYKGGARLPREETYEQSVVIQTWRSAHTPTDHDLAVSRAFTLFGALEDVLATDVAPGGVDFARITSGQLETIPFETGWASRFTVTVTAVAALT